MIDTTVAELEEWLVPVYLGWVAREVRLGLTACEMLSTTGPSFRDGQIADALLTATARISRLVRAPNGRRDSTTVSRWKKARRATLERLLDVPAPPTGPNDEDRWCLGSRKVRDASEHFDERLDTFLMAYQRPTGDQVEAGLANWSEWNPPWRLVLRDPLRIVMAGDEVSVEPLFAELRRLAAVLKSSGVLMVGPPDAPLGAITAAFPEELRLDAPTRRPNKPATTDLDPERPTE